MLKKRKRTFICILMSIVMVLSSACSGTGGTEETKDGKNESVDEVMETDVVVVGGGGAGLVGPL